MQITQERGASPYAIVVMGVSGCGKSTLMKHLAQRLSAPAFEGDTYHLPASVAKMQQGIPLQDADRWPWLDHLGQSIGLATREHGIAVAACSALRLSYRKRLAQAAAAPLLFVLLDGSREQIGAHLAARTGHFMPTSLLDSQFATLERPSADERSLTLPCYMPADEAVAHVMRWASTHHLA